MSRIGITVYGCEHDEAEAFRAFSPHYGVTPLVTGAAVTAANAALAHGNRCVSVGHRTNVSRDTLLALKESGVRYLSTRSVGINHIDVEAAECAGIAVGNVAYSPGSVADYTLMLMLMAIRDAKPIVSGAERLDFRLPCARGRELRDMTVGVVGTGPIGMAVIDRLRGFGCRVLSCGRSGRSEAGDTLDALLERSDILTLHVPLCKDTYHMIGRAQIAAMKRGAFLINTARGGIVDTGALIAALESGRIGGAALDVLEGEEGLFYFDCTQKPIDNPFLLRLKRMPNVIITPHTAYYTGRALRDTVEATLQSCLDFERRKGLA